MKRIIVYIFISFFCLILASCSLKHKWQNNQKEKLSRKKQKHISHVLTSERIILDTSFQIGHSKLKNYRLWRLSGKVNIQANGTMQTDQAILQTWHSETDSQQTRSLKTTYQNKKEAESFTVEESIVITTKTRNK